MVSEKRLVNNVQYDWFVSPEQLADIRAQVALEIEATLEVMPARPPSDWYGNEGIERPATVGALESTNQLNKQLTAMIAAGFLVRGLRPQKVDATSVIASPQFRDFVKTNVLQSYLSTKATAERLTSRVSNNIIKATQGAQSPRDLNRAVKSSFEIAKGEIVRSTDTGVNQAYTDGIIKTADIVAEQTDTEPRVIHISALTSTTRAHHAARHRLEYTVDEQEAWWSEGANRIHCKCSVIPVIVAVNG